MNSRGISAPVIIFLVVVVLIGGVLAYKLMPGMTTLAPEAALAQSIERLKAINSLSIFSLTKFTPSADKFFVNPFTLKIEGDLDKEHLDLDIEFEEKTENAETYLKSKVLLFKEEMYILFSEASQQGFSFSAYSGLASQLQDKPEVLGEWMKVNFEQALEEKMMGEEGIEQFQRAFAPDLFSNLKDTLPQLLSKQSKGEIQLVSETEKLDGVPAYHFQAELDKKDIKDLLAEADSPVAAEQIKTIEKASFNYWIDKKEALPLKITYQFLLRGGTEYYNEYKLSNYNQKFSFKKPTAYLDFVEEWKKEEAELAPAKAKARDASRQADLRQIAIAMEMYYGERDEYLQSKTIPVSIGVYMREVPKDPLSDKPYNWLDNTSGSNTGCDSQSFCVWAELEREGYYIASETGTKKIKEIPQRCPCWEMEELKEELPNGTPSERDVRRKVDMRQIVTAQEIYYGANDEYYTSASYPMSIGNYMPKTPSDPGPGSYVWVNNTLYPQKFCVYATLESEATTAYYTASHGGTFYCDDAVPTLNDCCFP